MAKIAISFQNSRAAEAFDDAAEGQVVVGDAGARASGSRRLVPLV